MMGFRSTFTITLAFVLFLSASLLYVTLSLPEFADMPKPKPKYPSGVPNKFDPDGNVQHFPGNTIICHLPNSSELYSSMLVLYDRLKQSPLSHLYAMLPPTSWHMTVFEGVVDKNWKPGYWPSNLPADTSLGDCTALFKEELSSFDLQTTLPYHMQVVGMTNSGLGLHVEPQPTDNTNLRTLRDRLAKLLQIRHPDHDHYGFHISLGYLLRYLTKEQKRELADLFMDHFKDMPKEFALGPPEFCVFEDMYAYEPILYLENSST